MKTDRYRYILLLILGSGIVCSIICAIFAIVLTIFAPNFVKEHFSTSTAGVLQQMAIAGMISGFVIGSGIMSFIMFFASVAHWANPLQTGHTDPIDPPR